MTKKALLIGINYHGSKMALRGCINDVKNTEKVLKEKFEYLPENITIVTEESPRKPTKSIIMHEVKRLVADAKEGDVLYFHYSGHGYKIRDYSGDETDGFDEVLVPLDYARAGMITDDWLYANMPAKLPKGVKLFCVLDCCHSGTGLDLKYNFRYNSLIRPNPLPRTYKSEEWKENYVFSVEKQHTPLEAMVCAFSGCEDPQTSADAYIKGSAQGAFTSCFLDVIQSEHVRNYTLKQILKEVNCRLMILRMSQRSQLSLAKMEDCEELFYV